MNFLVLPPCPCWASCAAASGCAHDDDPDGRMAATASLYALSAAERIRQCAYVTRCTATADTHSWETRDWYDERRRLRLRRRGLCDQLDGGRSCLWPRSVWS